MSELTHFDDSGNAAMVDVSNKDISERTATAAGTVTMGPATMKLIVDGGVKKGDVLSVAQLPALWARRKHRTDPPLPAVPDLSHGRINMRYDRHALDISATTWLKGRTGVEMEALTAVSIAALTVYDMCKAVDRGMKLENIRLIHKAGGASGEWHGA